MPSASKLEGIALNWASSEIHVHYCIERIFGLKFFKIRRDNAQLGILRNTCALLYREYFWSIGRGVSRTKIKGKVDLAQCLS